MLNTKAAPQRLSAITLRAHHILLLISVSAKTATMASPTDESNFPIASDIVHLLFFVHISLLFPGSANLMLQLAADEKTAFSEYDDESGYDQDPIEFHNNTMLISSPSA